MSETILDAASASATFDIERQWAMSAITVALKTRSPATAERLVKAVVSTFPEEIDWQIERLESQLAMLRKYRPSKKEEVDGRTG